MSDILDDIISDFEGYSSSEYMTTLYHKEDVRKIVREAIINFWDYSDRTSLSYRSEYTPEEQNKELDKFLNYE